MSEHLLVCCQNLAWEYKMMDPVSVLGFFTKGRERAQNEVIEPGTYCERQMK